jgi:diguanylate cyclase (GGDEF)-like protein/PAS domain S-box-containing protein
MHQKVLVVDNSPVILRLMENFLTKEGHEVLCAVDGLEALEHLKSFRPDVIITDLVMPRIPGDTLCRIIRTIPELKEAIVILLSGAAVEQELDFTAFGAHACIAKGPFERIEENIRSVFAVLARGEIDTLAGDVIGTENVFKRIITEELLSIKRHFDITLMNMHEGFLELTMDGRIVFLNPAAAAILGREEEQILSASFYTFFDENQAVLLRERMAQLDDKPIVIGEGQPFPRGNRYLSITLVMVADPKQSAVLAIVQDITARKSAEEQLRKYSYDMEQLLNISREMTSTTDLRRLYRIGVVAAKELLGLDFSTLMLMSEDKSGLTIADTIGFAGGNIGRFNPEQGQGLSTYVIRNKRPDTVADYARENRFQAPEFVKQNNIHSAICVPMLLEDNVFGVLIGHTSNPREFSQEDISLYQGIGNQMATAIKNAMHQESLKKERKKLHDITSQLAEGLYVIDRGGDVTFVNEEAVRLLGWSQEELNEKGVHELIHFQKADGTPLTFDECNMHNVVQTGKLYVSSDEVFVRRDGTVFPVSVVVSPIMEDDRIVRSVTTFRDISALKQIEEEKEKLIFELRQAEVMLRRLSRTDGLTGLKNRRTFDELLYEEWRRGIRGKYPLSLMMVDVDFFKKFNDRYGHLKGDECLKLLASVLRNVAQRPGDVVARFGGEEFIILLPMIDLKDTVAIAERIRLQVESLKFPNESSKISSYLTISIGVASSIPNRKTSSTELIQHADEALYQAKEEGRNRVIASCQADT